MLKEKNIVYLVGEFPSVTEHFILQELVELRKNGVFVQIMAINRSRNLDFEIPDAKIFLQEVLFYKRDPFIGFVSLLYCFWTYPSNFLRHFRSIISTGLLQNMKHLLISAFFIYRHRQVKNIHLHAHFASLPAGIAMMISEITGSPFSISAHAHDIYTVNPRLEIKLRRADFVITCTRTNKDFLERNYSPKLVFHIYHGLDISKWPFLAKKEIHTTGEIKILAVGRLIEKKGFIYLLQAISLLKAEFTIACTIVGDGPDLATLKSFATGSNLKVEFTGALPQTQICELYHTHSIFVSPNILAGNGDRDGLPNVLLEALATGIPVIASDISAIHELIINNETGLLVPEKNAQAITEAIRRLIADPLLYSRISEKGRVRIAGNFSLDQSTKSIMSLFDRFVYGKN